jgi:hypothetical protein
MNPSASSLPQWSDALGRSKSFSSMMSPWWDVRIR